MRTTVIAEPDNPGWKSLCAVGGIAALVAILIAPAEMVISLLPEVQRVTTSTVTVADWFTLFQNHWYLGLRNLGLLNLAGAALLAPAILAVWFVLRRENEAYATLGTILFFVGIAVYIAGNRGFPMLALSHQYASATTDAERSLIAAAGQAMLAEGQSRSGVLVIEFACLMISAVMLRGTVFSKATACAGMLGNGLMMIVEIAFLPPRGVGMIVAAAGGLALMIWYLLIGRRLLQLRRL